MIDKMTSVICRLFFAVAFILLIVAVWDRVIILFGWTIAWYYMPSRLFEFSTMLMIFVIALVLRQIREELKNK
jgi:hypothetical protein